MLINHLFQRHAFLGKLFLKKLKTALDLLSLYIIVNLPINELLDVRYLQQLVAHSFLEAQKSFAVLFRVLLLPFHFNERLESLRDS